MLVDSHCHLDMLDLTPFNGDLNGVLDHAKQLGVEHFLCVAVDPKQHITLTDIAEKHSNVWISVGSHPNNPSEPVLTERELLNQAIHPKVIAIGETGLDYYRSQGDITWQQERFALHIDAAIQTNKPLIIHSRAAKDDTLAILRSNHADKIGGVFHCFAEDWAMAKKGIDLGFYISFSGIVTFKNAQELQQVAKKIPIDRMLVETDFPYLAPTPYRGKPNLPGYTRHVAEFIAQLRGQSFEDIAQATTKNFFALFNV